MSMIHPTAQIAADSTIGSGTRIWRNVQVREHAQIGCDCNLGQNTYVDDHVIIGNRVKVQNNASLYRGLAVEDGVFIGPHVVFTNDRVPRAINPDGSSKGLDDWTAGRTSVRYGASIGAGAVIVTGVTIGRWAMVGAGAVVTTDVADHALVLGCPARVAGYISAGGMRCATQAEAIAYTATERIAEQQNTSSLTYMELQ